VKKGVQGMGARDLPEGRTLMMMIKIIVVRTIVIAIFMVIGILIIK